MGDLRGVNKTNVVLIPKNNDPKFITDFRPISLCNVLYKILSKTLANRLKVVLLKLISKNQSAFVPNRLITDNALVAFEIFYCMKRKNRGNNGVLALKLDMSKAYDRVEWSFLEVVMTKFGFSRRWVDMVLSCLRSVSFSFVVNGSVCGNVIPSRGLRQGDPISPYLFLLCAEAFSSLLHKASSEKRIHGAVASRGGPIVSHLFFADDSILFARANLQESSVIANIISVYERASGQKINYSKSEIYFSKNVPATVRNNVQRLGVTDHNYREVRKDDF